ncbi:hypothetical protein OROHE_003866 [Orobanche hederae]
MVVYLIDELMKVQTVNEVNKDFVIEALRSISELITWGDQHDAAYFEFFMEKQVKGELVRILKITRTVIFGDDAVNRFIAGAPQTDYFINLIKFFRDQDRGLESTSSIGSAIDEIEDHLYYFSDAVSAGIPDVGC